MPMMGSECRSGKLPPAGVSLLRSRHAGELVASMKRFIAVQEPTSTWAVFDIVDDVPAELCGVVLVGLEQAEAMTFASLANSRQAPRTRELRIAGTGLR